MDERVAFEGVTAEDACSLPISHDGPCRHPRATAVGASGALPGVAVYGFDDGSLRRTNDYAASALTRVQCGDGVPVERVWWSPPSRPWWAFWRHQVALTYALMENGERYRSYDDGLTWEQDIFTIIKSAVASTK